jgi:pre-peptidase
MSCIRRLAAAVLATAFCSHAAEEKKNERALPEITASIPFALSAGATNNFRVRGLNLTNATGLWFISDTNLSAKIIARGKATVPDKADAKKVGDTQLEIELALPEDVRTGNLRFVVNTPEGDTSTNQLTVIARDRLFDEKEPNGGFRNANIIHVPQAVRGAIGTAADVDVFQFEAKAGDKLHIESLSVHYGSPLDPIVTVYDAQGHTLAAHDDDLPGEADPLFHFSVPKDGIYFLSIMDAHDRGGENYNYLLLLHGE